MNITKNITKWLKAKKGQIKDFFTFPIEEVSGETTVLRVSGVVERVGIQAGHSISYLRLKLLNNPQIFVTEYWQFPNLCLTAPHDEVELVVENLDVKSLINHTLGVGGELKK